MNKLKTYQNNGGQPFLMNDLRFLLGQDEYVTAGIYKILEGYLNSFGTDFIISGCVAAGAPGSITEGWIFLGGEIIKVDAHTGTDVYYEKITDTYHADGSKTFQDGTTKDTYQQIRAKCTAAAGDLAYNGDTWADKMNDKFGTRLLRKVIEIGDWDMNADDSPPIPPVHGIAGGYAKIKAVVVMIRNDADSFSVSLVGSDAAGTKHGGVFTTRNTDIILERSLNGLFDTINYETPPDVNRGWITIWYEK